MTEIDREMTRMRAGQAAGAAIEMIAAELDHRASQVESAMFKILADPSVALDPDLAVQNWIALFEIHKLRQSLTQRQRAGRSAAARLAPAMDGAGG